ncbi:aldehyde dehydrogenase [Trujillonella endophytica]|uniref:Betaine-aldehyde dehydrogenase n=1 Tax=Trujillonella endophytica TaxID=673521 RepID=A0A1H8QK71_9ACTN|nr:aldehyde dehydrogenase [Trujillella endophytica]SEO54327.1 betaine-aldehyde dehydrogenase [Trujillella endophytica]
MSNAVQERADSGVRSFDKLFVGGRWVPPATDEVIEVVSPITEEVVATVPAAGPADMDAAVAAARRAFDEGPWPRMAPAERAAALRRVAEEVGRRIPEMEASFTAEIGAPEMISKAFHANATAIWDDAATLAGTIVLEEQRALPDGAIATVVREPVGVAAVIIPWNGPVATASLKIAPALAAGCTVVLKPAPEGPVSVLVLAEALEAAGLPEGVVSVLPGGREVGEHLVRHPDVDKVSFTGSTVAGRRVMQLCGERIARVTLELGGKSAAIVLPDADVAAVAQTVTFANIGNSGQVCAALTRLVVPRDRQEEVVEAVRGVMESVRVGDPREEGVLVGPLAAERQRERVEGYIRTGIEEGARLVTGGGRPEGLDRGWYVQPTLFADVDNSMRIAQEEIFGPVLVVIPYDTVDDAVRIANDSPYGLSGAVFTADPALGESVARRVRTGQIYVNDWGMCVTQPFGGFKQSGLGREGGLEGIGAFLETKVIQGI